MSSLIIWNNGAISNPWGGCLLTPVTNELTLNTAIGNTAYMFDLRVMNKAISESGGKAAESDLGTISYVFDDVKNNDGKVTLPFG